MTENFCEFLQFEINFSKQKQTHTFFCLVFPVQRGPTAASISQQRYKIRAAGRRNRRPFGRLVTNFFLGKILAPFFEILNFG